MVGLLQLAATFAVALVQPIRSMTGATAAAFLATCGTIAWTLGLIVQSRETRAMATPRGAVIWLFTTMYAGGSSFSFMRMGYDAVLTLDFILRAPPKYYSDLNAHLAATPVLIPVGISVLAMLVWTWYGGPWTQRGMPRASYKGDAALGRWQVLEPPKRRPP